MRQLSILLCGYLICHADAEATVLTRVVQTLNAKIHATTTIFYTTRHISLDLQAALQQQLPPKILASAKTTAPFEGLYNSRVLTVVFLAPTFMEQLQQLRALLHINRRITHALVLFVAYGYEDERWLFEWCWRQKFLHVLLSTEQNATVFTTYTPFPRLQLLNTTLSTYFDEQYATRNLRGYAIRYDGSYSAPRSLIFEDAEGKTLLLGFLPRLTELFARLHNATLQRIRRSTVYKTRECLQIIARKELDLCTDYYFLGDEVYLTKPLYLYNVYLMVPCAHQLPSFYYFAAPFTMHMWLWIALMLILVTLILALMCWWRYSRWCFHQLFLDLVACLLYMPLRLRPFTGYTQRLLYIILVIGGYLLSTYYLALLSSIFSVHINEKEMKGLSDLKARNISVILSDIDIGLLRSYNASLELLERAQKIGSDELSSKQLALDTRYAYLCAADKCNLLLNQQKYLRNCRMRIIKPSILTVWGGIIMANDTFFENILYGYLQRVYEAGIHTHLQRQSHADAMRMNITKYFHTENAETVKPLNLEYFHIPGLVLTIGYALALMAFVSELVKFYYWK